MIHLLYGSDDYGARARLREVREALASGDDMLSSNTTVLPATVRPEELLAHASAMPFLSSSRLVVVEGLLARIGEERKGRRGRGKADKADDPLELWRDLVPKLADPATVPDTTTIVFIERKLDPRNAALTLFSKVATTQRFDGLKDDALRAWVARRGAEKGVEIDGRAVSILAKAVGNDLWAIDNELDKLAAYADGDAVDAGMVERIVAPMEQSKLWDLTDAVVAGNERKAVAALARLLAEGEPAPLLASMVARQYRQLAQVKDMRERRVSTSQIASATGVPDWKVDSVAALAQRYTWAALRAAYRVLVEADLSVKRGLQDDESALQLAVHTLCARVRRRPVRATGGRRCAPADIQG